MGSYRDKHVHKLQGRTRALGEKLPLTEEGALAQSTEHSTHYMNNCYPALGGLYALD